MISTQADSGSKSWSAPAKLNLFLHITGRRADGYHELQSLFQILDWGDELKFHINNSGQIDRSNHVEGIPEAEDICIKAAKLLQTYCGIEQGVSIELLKRVPLGAGLGGGSSDAATVLLALNELWSCGLNRQQLAEIGLELGADVPVFVHGHSALAEGRGEKLRAVTLGQRYYVLVFPGINVSTAKVFNHPQLKRDSPQLDMSHVALEPGRNDCESATLALYPELKTIMQDLRKWGQPHMSGTGSAIFLPFSDKKSAIRATTELKCRYNVRPVGGVDQSQALDAILSVGD
ncbi:MAG: 4-(cytidine 5'-diphospho)-2-C-methyl-D-erythritol kinase [Xanthomonadales bacterium]|nr:4-(cytidine 5'-diphospho)-2-C-methyl-D-erythritol kinase [Xanthomonadales bacterium]